MAKHEKLQPAPDPKRRQLILEGHRYDIPFGSTDLPTVGRVNVNTIRHTTGAIIGWPNSGDVTVVYYRE